MAESAPDRRIRRSRRATLALLTLLLTLAGTAVLRETGGAVASVVLAAALVLPLLLPLPGLWRGHRRVYAWATLCLTPHFVYALTELVANPRLRGLAVTMLVTSLALAIALVAHLRFTRPEAA